MIAGDTAAFSELGVSEAQAVNGLLLVSLGALIPAPEDAMRQQMRRGRPARLLVGPGKQQLRYDQEGGVQR